MFIVGCIFSGKYLSGICLVGEMSVGDVSGRGSVRRGCVWSGKCPSGMCLVGEMSIGDASGRGTVCRGSVRQGGVRRGNVRWGMCPGIGMYSSLHPHIFVLWELKRFFVSRS